MKPRETPCPSRAKQITFFVVMTKKILGDSRDETFQRPFVCGYIVYDFITVRLFIELDALRLIIVTSMLFLLVLSMLYKSDC